MNKTPLNSRKMMKHRADLMKEIEANEKQRLEDNRMWSAYNQNFQFADNLYRTGDKEQALIIYEQTVPEMLKYGTRRLNLHACFQLVRMYTDLNRMNDAWRLTNQIQLVLMKEGELQSIHKVRYEQYRILKKEKRFIDALSALLTSWYLKGCSPDSDELFLNPDYMLREGKTTAKGAGLSPEDFRELIDQSILLARRGYKTERDIRNLYSSYMKFKGLISQ